MHLSFIIGRSEKTQRQQNKAAHLFFFFRQGNLYLNASFGKNVFLMQRPCLHVGNKEMASSK